MTDESGKHYEVAVIGGGAAGLNGALLLSRARRSVVVIDSGEPRNAPATGVHGLLGREGVPPGELLESGREEVRDYGGHVVSGEVVAVTRDGEEFVLDLGDGRSVRALRLLVTTGLVDELPEVAGLRERWGADVVHCPYCHGWEVRDRTVGVLATGPMSVHQALLFRQWSFDVKFFSHNLRTPTGEEAERLAARGIQVVDGAVESLEVGEQGITGVRLVDGTVVGREVLAIAPRMTARAAFLAELGLRAVEHPSGIGEYVPAEGTGATEVEGVWVAGNVTDPSAQVGPAAAAGATAAARINADLVEEETARAVTARRDPFSAESEARGCEAVLGERRHGL
ncbi:NAD(P)/FAD-dependent oxidoreductase [Actinopolyspora sp. H202]|uniref:NAD(P)/FAD-dependent oxidoreductase n=1 Tax=Actinopolyspora sp. H202 TaxID=1500456 RepID=UPI003EE51F9A